MKSIAQVQQIVMRAASGDRRMDEDHSISKMPGSGFSLAFLLVLI